MRTKYCGEIRLSDINKKVILCGWVDRRRDFKNFIFVDLRDREGIIQIFFSPINNKVFNNALQLKHEFCIQVTGIVQERSYKNKNKNLTTGDIEILASELNILNTSDILPIDVKNVNHENIRLKYRYLDLRHNKMIKNLTIRNDITNIVQSIMKKKNFLNIETPLLTKLTPEGARNYLVPSRIHKEKYYALPQSPQLFKQLLMISGIDKYYQIVKCFRDEDLRSDRQPEFTQIDIEASFVTEKNIQNIAEEIISVLWNKIINYQLKKFPVISFDESIRKYGCDKPDLRNSMKLIDIDDIFQNTCTLSLNNNYTYRTAALLIPKGLLLLNKNKINFYNDIIKKYNDIYTIYIKVKNIELSQKGIFSSIHDIFSIQQLMDIIHRVHATNGDLILIISGKNNTVNKILSNLRIQIGHEINLTKKNIWKPIWIKNFPMFEKNDVNTLLSVHHPFTAPKNATIQELQSSPESIIANSYDLVMNGYEIGGGSVRIHEKKMQEAVFHILGMSSSDQKKHFGFFMNALKYGTPPHAGIALGLDRITMLLTNSKNIKDVIAFPKTNSAACLMSEAPSQLIY